jgi:hypothetical protein
LVARVRIDDRLPGRLFVLVHQCRITEGEHSIVLGFECRPGVDAIVFFLQVGRPEGVLAGDPPV